MLPLTKLDKNISVSATKWCQKTISDFSDSAKINFDSLITLLQVNFWETNNHWSYVSSGQSSIVHALKWMSVVLGLFAQLSCFFLQSNFNFIKKIFL